MAGCVLAALSAAPPCGASAATPKRGSWDSGGRAEPTVGFDVRGPGRSRIVARISVPLRCPGEAEPTAWAFSDFPVRVRRGGRFATDSQDFALRGRFVSARRAEVTVHTTVNDECDGPWRYVVRPVGGRVAVRTGLFVALAFGGSAYVELDVDSLGRMVSVDTLAGSVPATCSDGSHRSVPLGSPDHLVLAAPITPAGTFALSAAGTPTIGIHGAFDHGSVAGAIDLSSAQPGGVSCRALGVPIAGALSFPVTDRGADGADFPGWPLVLSGT